MNHTYETVINEIVKDNIDYVEETTYKLLEDGSKEKVCSVKYPKPSDEPSTPAQTQLDRIEAKLDTMTNGESEEVLNILLGVAENE